MAGPFFQGTTGSLQNIVSGLGQMGGAYAGHRKLQDQKKKDQEFLDYLTGQLNPDLSAPAPEPMPVADLGMGMPDTAAPVTPGAEDLTSLVQGRRQAAKELLSSPESALQVMVEAKKRGVSTDANSLLDFIAKMGQQAEVTEREDKKAKAGADREAKREMSRKTREEALIRSRERIARIGADARLKAAGISADASKYGADRRGGRLRRPALPDLASLDLPNLEDLLDGLEVDRSELKSPNKAEYDAYDKLDMIRYREDYGSFDDDRSELDDTIRAVKEAIRIKQKPAPAAGTVPPKNGGSVPAPAPNPGAGASRPRPDAPDQDIAAYLKANGKLVSPETIAITRQRLQGR